MLEGEKISGNRFASCMSIKMIDASVLESQDGIYWLIRGWFLWIYIPAQRRAKFISLHTRMYIYGRPDANFRATPFISSHAF
jgi:hypothetical protein